LTGFPAGWRWLWARPRAAWCGTSWRCGSAATRGGLSLGTLFINVTGSAFIGFFGNTERGRTKAAVAPQARLLVIDGHLRRIHDVLDVQPGDAAPGGGPGSGARAAMNATASVLLCLVGVWLGHALASALNQR